MASSSMLSSWPVENSGIHKIWDSGTSSMLASAFAGNTTLHVQVNVVNYGFGYNSAQPEAFILMKEPTCLREKTLFFI